MFGVCYPLCQVKKFGDFSEVVKATESFKKINNEIIFEFGKAIWWHWLLIKSREKSNFNIPFETR